MIRIEIWVEISTERVGTAEVRLVLVWLGSVARNWVLRGKVPTGNNQQWRRDRTCPREIRWLLAKCLGRCRRGSDRVVRRLVSPRRRRHREWWLVYCELVRDWGAWPLLDALAHSFPWLSKVRFGFLEWRSLWRWLGAWHVLPFLLTQTHTSLFLT